MKKITPLDFKNSGLRYIWIACLTILTDQLSKALILANFDYAESLEVLPFFNFTLVFNTGAAFSFLSDQSGWQHFFFGGFAIVVSLFLLRWLSKIPNKPLHEPIGINLILGGALGNLIDRLVQQKVTDFLHFHVGEWSFAIFNVADVAISLGAGLMILSLLFLQKKQDKT